MIAKTDHFLFLAPLISLVARLFLTFSLLRTIAVAATGFPRL